MFLSQIFTYNVRIKIIREMIVYEKYSLLEIIGGLLPCGMMKNHACDYYMQFFSNSLTYDLRFYCRFGFSAIDLGNFS